jgi:hypothetical protein
MTFLLGKWLKDMKRKVAPGARTPRGAMRPRVVPRLEELEDRTVPSTLAVTSAADDGSAGTLRTEIAAANSGDTIKFDPSLAGQTIALTGGELAITESLDIEGLGANQLTVSGNGTSRVFDVSSGGTVTLAGMAITDGFTNGFLPGGIGAGRGGGIWTDGSLTLNNCAISGNVADGLSGDATTNGWSSPAGDGLGGGIYMAGGTLTVNNSTLSDNSARGGTGYNWVPGGGGYGGGLYIGSGTVSINNSSIYNNQAVGGLSFPDGGAALGPNGFAGGGGIVNDSAGTLMLNGTAVWGNSPDDIENLGTFNSPRFVLSGFPSSTTAGTASPVTVTVLNADGSTDTGYTGTVHFTSGDPRATLPADYTFTSADNGTHTFTATLKTAGTGFITATDSTVTYISGSETGITVTPAAASKMIVAGYPSAITAGLTGTFTVTLEDTYGNVASGYTGTVHFTSSDGKAALPANYTFTTADAGKHTFSATLTTAGTQSLTATDTATGSLTGTDGGITVNPAAASKFLIAAPSSVNAGVAFSLTLTVEDAYGNVVTGYTGTVHFSSTDNKATMPANYTFTAADKGAHTFTGLILRKKGMQKITITDTHNSALTASDSISVG